MRVIGQWNSLIQLLTIESVRELMGNSCPLFWVRGLQFSILVKQQQQQPKHSI